ncbi:murein hydrolase activator EnvC family protein [Clostridium gasigenes]|uniref:Septal ring factor EnvC, activator of murein hydrolases AmiA and AmiB n=1 Tax=Clostridium gasigenes TaxID=94869 RepID=A0A1H0S923_9CLOT|nr:M23 family metallopeptidase [Clostridium gasigenes]SDP37686.1 Septal ring factor EnvC, activator of murein hydrolases AmiA and AmiB [Clostridium gasigenes]
MNKIKNKIIIVLCLIFFSTSYVSVFAESSDAIKNEMEVNKEAMNEIDKDKNKIEEDKVTQGSELDKLLEEIENKGAELSVAEKDVEVFQVKIDKLQEDINVIQKSIDDAEAEILQKEKLIDQKEEELVKTRDILDKRIRSYYKMNITLQYIYMIIKSDGLGQLLSNIQAISRVINIDKELMDSIKKFQKELAVEKDNLDKRVAKEKKDKEDISYKQNEIFEAQKEFVVIKDAKQIQMNKLLALESEKQNLIATLTSEEIALQEKIGDLVSYNDDLKAELDNIFNSISNSNNGNNSGSTNENSNGTSNESNNNSTNNESNNNSGTNNNENTGEGFLRPTDGPITDPFGGRTNPVTLQPGFHNGVDFGNASNTPIKASKSGVVTYAGWINGYGNSVIIDHGGGVTTLYGHANRLDVSVNQNVTRGETIALVGSTGMSTGPHLHFEIRINAQPVDPMGYV